MSSGIYLAAAGAAQSEALDATAHNSKSAM